MKQGTAERAAKWWGDHLRNGSPLDNGDPSPRGGMTMMMGLMLQRDTLAGISEEQVVAFEVALVERIQPVEGWLSFGVDYGPGMILGESLAAAGITSNTSILPWKTSMVIKDDVIKAGLGYRAEHRVID